MLSSSTSSSVKIFAALSVITSTSAFIISYVFISDKTEASTEGIFLALANTFRQIQVHTNNVFLTSHFQAFQDSCRMFWFLALP